MYDYRYFYLKWNFWDVIKCMYLRTEAILQKNSGVKEFMDPNLDLKPHPHPFKPTPKTHWNKSQWLALYSVMFGSLFFLFPFFLEKL